MKKALITMALLGLVIGAAAAGAQAQERRVSVFLNFGGTWSVWIVPEYFNLGLQTDVRLNKFLTLSPEISFWSRGLRYDNYYFAPDAMANLTVGRFFAGAGFTVLKYIARFTEDGPWLVRSRYNVGYAARHLKLTVAAVPTSDYVFGIVSVGLGF